MLLRTMHMTSLVYSNLPAGLCLLNFVVPLCYCLCYCVIVFHHYRSIFRSCVEEVIRILSGDRVGLQGVHLSWRSGNMNKQATPTSYSPKISTTLIQIGPTKLPLQPHLRRLSTCNGINYHPYARSYGVHNDNSTEARGMQ